MEHESLYESFADVPADAVALSPEMWADVPASLGVLPDGRDTVVIGDVTGLAELNHKQGDNPYGFENDCGLAACGVVLRQFGVEVTEADVVTHAVNSQPRLCFITDNPASSGGTTPDMLARILNDFGVPAHVERGQSLEDLAADIEKGSGVIIGANAGLLWNDSNHMEYGQSNHAVVVISVARDPGTGEIQGFYINDSGKDESGKFVDASTMTQAWVNAPRSSAVVTDVIHGGAVPVATGVAQR